VVIRIGTFLSFCKERIHYIFTLASLGRVVGLATRGLEIPRGQSTAISDIFAGPTPGRDQASLQ